MELQPCARCLRHVATTELACPFCAAPLTPVVPRVLARGRFGRAAVFAGATTLAACGGTPAPKHVDNTVQADAKPPIADASIWGVIIYDGRPMVGHTLHLSGGTTEISATTNARGEYAFGPVPSGEYTLLVYSDGHPRHSPDERHLTVVAGEAQRVDASISSPAPDTGPCCKPYGAPPARRRVV